MKRSDADAPTSSQDVKKQVEPEDGWFVYCFSHGTRWEACRPYWQIRSAADGQKREAKVDDLKNGLRLYLNLGYKPGVVFVRRGNQQRPDHACWRSNGAKKGRWRTLRFCAGCPDPEVCGYLDQSCRLSTSGHPRQAFQPKPEKRHEKGFCSARLRHSRTTGANLAE